ncbi:M48 family metallopeptidase [bacterium]|nr:M48 family metallopeptidase [bacterium]MBT3795037.1 M48 family metallopeptidase [bacterium]MBT4634661.1 M48 family metallopeptidase [bacterium]
MLRKYFLVFSFICIFISCTTAPITGRSQLILLSEYQEINLGVTAYAQALKDNEKSSNQVYIDAVNRVGNRIAPATGKNYNWEFNVLKSDMINAWCLPGGKIAFYEGILDIMENEGQIAAVMGHEIAHATARHGGERMSLGILAQIGSVALQIALRDKDPAVQYAVFQAYIPTLLVGVILPFSRAQENESDEIGLIYMARAGYNPEEAVKFWEIMYETNKDKKRPPQWLSTHPATQNRISNLKKLLPAAMEIYNSSVKAETKNLH